MVRDHRHRVMLGRALADARPGELLLYEDPAGMLALAVTGASAQNVLGVRRGEPVTLAP